MKFLKNNWEELFSYVPNHNEEALMPIPCSPGYYRSFNSDWKELAFIGNFIAKFKPRFIVECGTFEARATEYFARKLMLNVPGAKKIDTIDAGGCIDHIGKGIVTFKTVPEWEHVKRIREARLFLLQYYENVSVCYHEGLVEHILPILLSKQKYDFIYQDASHMAHLLMNEWELIEPLINNRCIICFDDMKENNFVEEFLTVVNTKKWDVVQASIDRGQLWVERINI